MISPFRLLSLALLGVLGVVALGDQVSAQKRTGGPALKSQSVPSSRSGSDADSVGYFQMRVGGAANKTKKPMTNTMCAPVGGKRPARC
jgi:hypothetical protein